MAQDNYEDYEYIDESEDETENIIVNIERWQKVLDILSDRWHQPYVQRALRSSATSAIRVLEACSENRFTEPALSFER